MTISAKSERYISEVLNCLATGDTEDLDLEEGHGLETKMEMQLLQGLRDAQSALTDTVRGESDPGVVIDKSLSTLATYLGAQVGVFHLADPGVVLVDVEMPVMRGFETATLIRGNEDTRHVPITFVTATQRGEAYFSDGSNAGAVDYLTKPINEEFLRSKVKVLLELELVQTELERSNNALRDLRRQRHTTSARLSVTSNAGPRCCSTARTRG